MLSYKNENGNVKELAAEGSMGDLLAESAYGDVKVVKILVEKPREHEQLHL